MNETVERGNERISNDVMAGLRAEAENCLLRNNLLCQEHLLREGNRSPAIIDFGEANTRVPGTNDEDWRRIIHGGLDMHYMRRLLESRGPGLAL
ncbi:hypothetical protein ARMSODRAFT_961513 [Armillaria solidipes]|uniref:Uncharacterized protein n=1 Tax=Armillaria solidipes TaxID=1076256 RepID=A0A2H3BDV3_9AGAR|nr:hypothetical protein ARMSODRAFT_961513 [Armillaria solidipes]